MTTTEQHQVRLDELTYRALQQLTLANARRATQRHDLQPFLRRTRRSLRKLPELQLTADKRRIAKHHRGSPRRYFRGRQGVEHREHLRRSRSLLLLWIEQRHDQVADLRVEVGSNSPNGLELPPHLPVEDFDWVPLERRAARQRLVR